MVNQLGKHSVNMEALMGKDLDQLAEVITGAMHEKQLAIGAKPGPGAAIFIGDKEGNGEPLAALQLNPDKGPKLDKGPDSNQKDIERIHGKGAYFFS